MEIKLVPSPMEYVRKTGVNWDTTVRIVQTGALYFALTMGRVISLREVVTHAQMAPTVTSVNKSVPTNASGAVHLRHVLNAKPDYTAKPVTRNASTVVVTKHVTKRRENASMGARQDGKTSSVIRGVLIYVPETGRAMALQENVYMDGCPVNQVICRINHDIDHDINLVWYMTILNAVEQKLKYFNLFF